MDWFESEALDTGVAFLVAGGAPFLLGFLVWGMIRLFRLLAGEEVPPGAD